MVGGVLPKARVSAFCCVSREWLVMGCLWAGGGPRWRLVFSFVPLSQGLWGWAKERARSRWQRPWRWWRAISLPWSQVRALIAPSGIARMRRVRAPAPGRALPAPGEGPPGRGSRWCARPGAPIALAPPLPMIRPRPPSSPVPPGRQLSGRPPGQPHAHDPGGLTTRRMGIHFCAPRRSRAPTRFLLRWRVDPRAQSPRG